MSSERDDTAMGGKRAAFPETPASAVLGVRDGDPLARARAFQVLVRAYWKPVYKSIRIRFRRSNEDAKDLTQSFFKKALEGDMFSSYDVHKARFRTFVRACLHNFVLNERSAAQRLKRGGGTTTLSLDFEGAEAELRARTENDEPSFEAAFDRDVARALHDESVRALREQLSERGKALYFELFARYDLVEDPADRPTYAELASDFSIKVTDVTNHLHSARRVLRRIVLAKLREITASEEEFRDEARDLLGLRDHELTP